ncbi:hypothetical protein SMICM17S_06340 [Streptomyces microflavus]
MAIADVAGILVPGQIADGQRVQAVRQLHRVVPVAADEAAGRGREVVGGDVQGAGALLREA